MVVIDQALIERIALLSRLELQPDEVDKYTRQLRGILDYVEKLNALDVKDVPPLVHALENANVFREDVVRPSTPLEQIMANAPDRIEMFFKVPKVIEE